jgi:hypothetical protein
MNRLKNWVAIILFGIGSFQAQNNCLKFDGTNDDVVLNYSALSDFSINDKFTIEAWFNTTSSTAIIYSTLLNASPYTGHEVGFFNGQIYIQLINTYPSNTLRVETTSTFNDGNWHHMAFVYNAIPNGNNVQVYVDGVQQTLNTTINALTSSFNSGNQPHIGSRNAAIYFMNGSIDEIRVWNRNLCSAEIAAHKNCQLQGNEPGLVRYYNFNNGTAGGNNASVTNLPDITANNNNGTLNNFALSGASSNWVTSGANITGTCGPFAPSLSVSGNTLACSGTSVVLTASGCTSYTWTSGPTTASILVSPSVTTIYTVSATSATSCLETKTISVTAAASPTLSISGPTITVCAGQTINLGATGANNYTWQPGNLSGFFVNVSPTVTTTYTITGSSANGCTSTSLFTQTISTCAGITTELISNDRLFVYPNPTANKISVTGLDNFSYLEVFNAIGQKVKAMEIQNSSEEIDLSECSKGVYLLKLSGGNGSGVKRVIKE